MNAEHYKEDSQAKGSRRESRNLRKGNLASRQSGTKGVTASLVRETKAGCAKRARNAADKSFSISL